MSDSAVPFRPAFRALERALVRRAVTRIEPILWIEIVGVAALACVFIFWRVHMALASVAHDRGAAAAGLQLAFMLAALVIAGAGQVGTRHYVRLRSPDAAPPWLSLPLPARDLSRHLATMSRLQSGWLVAPAAGFLVAAAGVVPWLWLPPLALAFVVALDLAGRGACALALRRVAGRSARAGLPEIVGALAERSHDEAVRRPAVAGWGRARGAWALMTKDALLTLRVPAVRRRAALAALTLAVAALAWALPIETRGRLLVAFAVGLIAAALVAEWLIALVGADPPDLLRSLPIGVSGAWSARLRWVLIATTLLVALQAFTARGLSADARNFFLLCVGGAALAIQVLGLNYAVSLYPRSELAQRVLALSLGLAMAASLMVPLMGWIVLLTGVVHSGRRVARWSRAEER